MSSEQLMGIGEFARRTRLTVKQLRNYDDLGLLPPAHVDPRSSYRYYHRRQARTAITIALLRSLDLPLAEIHAILVVGPQEAAEIIERQRASVERRVERDFQTLRSLDRLLNEDELMPYEVTPRECPPLKLEGLRGSCAAPDLDRAVTRTIDELLGHLESGGQDRPVTGLYPLDLEGQVEFFVGIESTGDAPDAPLDRCALPPTSAVGATHTGLPAEIRLAYFPLLAHLQERLLDPIAPVRETYLTAPPEVPPDRAVTEITLPFAAPDIRTARR